MGAVAKSPRILLVEDYEDLRQTFGDLLSMKGYAVDCADDGQQALTMMKHRRPDIVITDLKMRHDGWWLRRKMLKDPRLASLPVIVVSAGEVQGCEDVLQAVACFEKPVDLEALLEVVEEHAARRSRVLASSRER